MPIGSYANLYYIAKELEHKKPKMVLDLGIGFGMNGVLVRQYVDMGFNRGTYLHGVEIHSEYDNPVWHLYNHISERTIETFLAIRVNDKYDFILMTDVIEHFMPYVGESILEVLPTFLNPGGIILISTPSNFIPQEAVHGNEYEKHLSHWAAKDFPVGYFILKNSSPDHHGDETLIMKYIKQ